MSSPSAADKEQYLNNVRQQVQMQALQEMMTKMSEKCFKACAGKHGTGLDRTEEACVVNCMDRYIDTMNVVRQSLENRQR